MHPLHAPPLHSGRMCPQLRKQEHKEKLSVSLAPPKCHCCNKKPPYTSAKCRITPFLSHRFDTSALTNHMNAAAAYKVARCISQRKCEGGTATNRFVAINGPDLKKRGHGCLLCFFFLYVFKFKTVRKTTKQTIRLNFTLKIKHQTIISCPVLYEFAFNGMSVLH